MSRDPLQSLRALDDLELVEASPRYDRDYSIFRARPTATVRPKSVAGLCRAVEWARLEHLPVVARAGASNTGGAAITDGLLVLMTDDAFGALEIDSASRRGRVGCGVRHDMLQRSLHEHGLWLPSDPSSGPLSFIGGNVNTRASGPHALRYGAIDTFIESVEGVLPDGTRFSTSEPDTIPTRLITRLEALAARIRADRDSSSLLESRRGRKCASGYDLLCLLDANDAVRAIPRLICGSMGTLCLTTAVTLRFEPLPFHNETMLIPFPSQASACEAVLELRGVAAAVEILSQSTARLVRSDFGHGGGHEESTLLLVEFQEHHADRVAELVSQATTIATTYGAPANLIRCATDKTTADRWWSARKTLLPRLQQSTRGQNRLPYSVVNDVGVAPQHLSRLLHESEVIFRRNELPSVIYGHAGSGNLHLRPLFNRGDESTVRKVALDVYKMVTEMGGTVTAEHGMGRLRAPFLEDEWGERISGYMREVKAIFDPDMTLNPGVMFVSDGHDFASSGWAWPPALE